MARERKPLSTTGRALAALALAWTAGYVDAAGYLLLLHVYTSHMTGNTAALAEGLAHGRIHDAALHAWPILAFVAGLMAGAVLTEAARRREIHSRLALVLGCEAGLRAAWMAGGGGGARDSLLWVGLPAMAMG